MIGNVIGPVTPGSTAVHVAAVIALLLVVFTGTWAGSLVTVAHEGGHVVLALLSGRNPSGFVVNESTGGGATRMRAGWGVSLIFIDLAGYLTPPLLGLARANLTLVWWMLFGALRSLFHLGLGGGESDAAHLSRETWIPAIAWVALFWFIAIVCLWVGGRRLLVLNQVALHTMDECACGAYPRAPAYYATRVMM